MSNSANDSQALLLQVSASLAKMEKVLLKEGPALIDRGGAIMEQRAKANMKKLEASFKPDFGKALDNVFDSSRLKVMDSGIARIGLFGSALEPLGPAGLVAAAGIAAVGAALAGSREAAKFADDIGDTANRLHVTTDALQEFRYANRAAGGDVAGADDALESFSITLGKAQQGLAKGQRPFLALGFTKAQIKGFNDAGEALDAVVKKIAGLSNVQQDAVIEQLGLAGIKPLIEAGANEMSRLRDEAHKVGVVMDAELVERGGELNDQFETVQDVINVQLKSALVDLGPILVGLLGLVANMASTANDIAESFKDIQDRTQTALTHEKEVLEMRLKIAATPFAKANVQKDLDKVNNALAAKAQAVTVDDMKAAFGIGQQHKTLKDTSGGGSTPRDRTADRLASADSSVASANKALYQALLSLTDDVADRATLQRKILNEDQAAADAQRAKQVADINADKTLSDATRRTVLAKLDEAKATEDLARAAQRRGIDAEELIAANAKSLERHREKAGYEIDELRAQQDLATTRQERRKIELEILARQKAINDEARANEQAEKQRRADAADPNTVHVISDNGAQKSADATFSAEQARILKETQGPLADYLDSIRSIDDAMQDAAVNGLQSLNAGIADLITKGGDAGDMIRNVLLKVLNDLANASLQSGEKSLFNSFNDGKDGNVFTDLFSKKRAMGGRAMAGQMYEVNELGGKKEGFIPDVNGRVVSSAEISSMAQRATAGRSGWLPSPSPSFDLRGAVVTQDLLDQMNAIGRRSALSGRAMASDDSRRSFAGRQAALGKGQRL